MWKSCVERVLAALVAGVLAGVVLLCTAGSAHAVSCYGHYCSGQDPERTGCSADATTVASDDFLANNGQLTWIELRWSPTCKTNWGRIRYDYGRRVNWMKVVQSTGYTQWTSSNNSQYQWTAMIYSPQLCVRAEIQASHESGRTACR